ncbi:DUF4435 domain-containing protein [Hymenobacter sp. HSC-4F20]|uniref:DUF4435 domain-containing protein n=1 Tax=Hymenobacter sp. HSC-4F20 TaxID=2864135 RepID=UPI001C72E527|nr:DUF4435 domain-containing protein [Hymenobacter sp. HSC-4F20]MBX0291499.1 DUF4435 domain-containing protein [Hymenobacter sp. HSC-4F20]
MESLSYSEKALSALPLFHRKKYVIYVEGPDDILFWDNVLQQLGLTNYIIKPAGGVEEIKKYSFSIIEASANIVVARDRDYEDFDGTIHNHPRIIYTYGHSIENSLQCSRIISKLIANYLRSTSSFEQEVANWHRDFEGLAQDLLLLEIANTINSKKYEITGKSCVKFLPTNKAYLLCSKKTKKHYENLILNFSDIHLETAASLLSQVKKNIIWLVRGHFLTAASLNFIKHIVKRERGSDFSMDHDSFYTMLISILNISLLDDEDRNYLNAQITTLLAA